MTIKNLAVFCGASSLADTKYQDLASTCGKMMADAKINLVYGGGGSGLMGAVAQSAHDHGAEVTGVYPNILNEKEPLNKEMDHTYIVDTMFERKDDMFSKSDAFLVLPGGYGTLDEFFEIVTLKYLGELDKPIVLVNHEGYWDRLLGLLDHIITEKFAPTSTLECFDVVDTLEEALEILKTK